MNTITPYTLVPDTEPMIEVDLATRKITVPESLYDIAVTGDNNAETLRIKVADRFDGVSLVEKNAFIWFRNARKEDYRQDIETVQHIDGSLILDWRIDERLTRYKGEVQFKVGFESTLYSLSSLPGKLNIAETLNAGTVFETQEESITEQFLRRLSDLELLSVRLGENIAGLQTAAAQIERNKEELVQLRNETKFLKEHAVLVD